MQLDPVYGVSESNTIAKPAVCIGEKKMSLRGTEKVATDVTTGSATKPRALGSLTGKAAEEKLHKAWDVTGRALPACTEARGAQRDGHFRFVRA